MSKKDYIWLTGFILAVVITTFVITMNLNISETQIITVWIIVCVALQITLTSVIIFKTKQKIKRQQAEERKE
ncbi:hypothetical protein [Lactobacillus sp. Sy-1]|uniref:hypothetical protein n=1 Tax=Lactobacillus sp. Sy-1 TaxID=2109645 RepID=UPI001C571523|nr:hypothetical protein [Lactobacillus sp. Sy-1]MBW1605742.1 hypothetical protein [Lactobacillus sp. Sy-1]